MKKEQPKKERLSKRSQRRRFRSLPKRLPLPKKLPEPAPVKTIAKAPKAKLQASHRCSCQNRNQSKDQHHRSCRNQASLFDTCRSSDHADSSGTSLRCVGWSGIITADKHWTRHWTRISCQPHRQHRCRIERDHRPQHSCRFASQQVHRILRPLGTRHLRIARQRSDRFGANGSDYRNRDYASGGYPNDGFNAVGSGVAQEQPVSTKPQTLAIVTLEVMESYDPYGSRGQYQPPALSTSGQTVGLSPHRKRCCTGRT